MGSSYSGDYAGLSSQLRGFESRWSRVKNRKEYQQEWYQKNKKQHAEKIKQRVDSNAAVARQLKSVPCMDCGGTFHWVAMDFDHRPGEEKLCEVSKLVSEGYSLDLILAEIAKCDVVCSNCHRVRTFVRRSG